MRTFDLDPGSERRIDPTAMAIGPEFGVEPVAPDWADRAQSPDGHAQDPTGVASRSDQPADTEHPRILRPTHRRPTRANPEPTKNPHPTERIRSWPPSALSIKAQLTLPGHGCGTSSGTRIFDHQDSQAQKPGAGDSARLT